MFMRHWFEMKALDARSPGGLRRVDRHRHGRTRHERRVLPTLVTTPASFSERFARSLLCFCSEKESSRGRAKPEILVRIQAEVPARRETSQQATLCIWVMQLRCLRGEMGSIPIRGAAR